MIRGVNADALEKIIKKENEKDFLIVDVRQPEEYRLDHIPGSINVPLGEIQFDPYSFEENRKLIFCCTRGVRSKVAAIFVSETGHDEDKLFHLENGLLDYSGEVLMDMPRVELFPQDINAITIMEKAINFEKGAFLFYCLAKEKLTGTKLYSTIDKISKDEIAHGKAIYNRIKKNQDLTLDFDTYFETCDGLVLEGGKPFQDVLDFLDKESSNPCMDILDFAIELEHCAYDLYKTMAESSEETKTKSMFFSLAQAEKKHLDQMINALELCV